ncbi:Lead, cadmium, zinc and mercury transporting ATPase; Copper-translocating P-type ATPase [hydrothermal vent metagenome]|uniref:Lead, cadmium, zinc and mercury transporting ATPase Copper-translocating P-type ATPase n=1 Tax=hydrothermal vent metagenome TaxID=652676 RepID=A0A3B0VJV4_9ZZZZ
MDKQHIHDTHEHSCEHEEHSSHSMGHGMGHGSASSYLRRFWIVTALLIPLALTNAPVVAFFHLPVFAISRWIQFVLATAIFAFSLVFFQHAWHEIRARAFGMMTLVSIAVGAGYTFSVVATFVPSLGVQFYLEIATLVWVLLFGHYLEARSSGAAGDALTEVAKLLPKKAHKILDGVETDIDIKDLIEGDTVVVKSGEKIPADGNVINGHSSVDEALISGESRPVAKNKGDDVVAGSVAFDGALTVRLTRVGVNSTIGQIQSLIAKAQMSKPRQARIADTASAVLTFSALAVSVLTFLVWFFILGASFAFAMTLAITVLVIACPHALGLAIPTVTTIATTLSAKNGVFIKNLAKIETIHKASYVVFDKTGTLTNGSFGVSSMDTFVGTKDDLLKISASLEQRSSHIIGSAIVAHAKKNNIELSTPTDFTNFAGKGIRANIKGEIYIVGNKMLMSEQKIQITSEQEERYTKLVQKGATVIFVSDKKQILGLIALSDEVKQEAYEAVRRIHELGIKVAMLTGDNEHSARGVADALGIDTYFAEVLPHDKYAHIQRLQKEGNTVLMVGDGVNDAPALSQADVGIAIGAGTDVTVEAGDVVLTRSNPTDVVRLVVLARAVYRKMIQNLWWALGYNVVAIPTAAGVFAYWGVFLAPEVGALLMSLSTVIVVANALTLRRINLSRGLTIPNV